MLSEAENQELTQVGPGTPGGELLRRYWHPIGVARELTPERPKKRVRLLGENLVLFRDEEGGYGLVGEQCAHRGASLYYGFLEDGCIRCPYHGWLYDKEGRCIEQPFEPQQSLMKHSMHHPAYPVQRMRGLLFAYLGPAPAPLLPRWDVIVREDGRHKIEVDPIINCNWLQCQENSIDPTHNYYLHGHMAVVKGIGTYDYRPIADLDFEVCEWGIMKRRSFGGDTPEKEGGHPALFPNILRHSLPGVDIDLQYRLPIDDTHTQVIRLYFFPSEDGPDGDPEDPTVEYISIKNDEGEFDLLSFPSQDEMAWETQGSVSNRPAERLGASDRGIVLWRQLLKEQIEIVKQGGEPIAVVRDPERNRMIAFSSGK